MAKQKESMPVFTKEQILKSASFAKYRDVLSVVLEEDRSYSKMQVREAVEGFYKGK